MTPPPANTQWQVTHSTLDDATSPGHSALHKRIADARASYAIYLDESKHDHHFLSVTSPKNPLRRVDGDAVTHPSQLVRIQKYCKWDPLQNRWNLKHGGPIVLESEIFNTVISYQRALPGAYTQILWQAIKKDVLGIQEKDVKRVRSLWVQHKLGELDTHNDVLWGREATLPRKCLYYEMTQVSH